MADALVDMRLRSPSTVIIAGPTGSGKTQLLMDFIMQANSVADPSSYRNNLLLFRVAALVWQDWRG